MKYIDFLSCFIGAIIFSFVLINGYNKMTESKAKINHRIIIVSIINAFLATLLNYLPANARFVGEVILMIIIFEILFKENIGKTMFKTLIIYLIVIILDFSIGFIVMKFPNLIDIVNGTSIIKGICTVIMSVLFYMIFNIKFFVNTLNKLVKIIEDKLEYIYLILLLIIIIAFYIIAYYYMMNSSISFYIITFVVLGILLLLCIIISRQYIKNKTNEKDQETLLELMNEYEFILDKDRENRHEMLNNLVVLKSYNNKGSKEYEKLLDEIIKEYQNKKANEYASLYKLPRGIKGIVYYKINNILNSDIRFNTLITKESYQSIEELELDKYYDVCKILGILLDNAIEACKESKDKEILIDIYTEENITNIYIENTFKGKIDLKEISKKGYSTKGKNRGLGLHIVNRLIKSNDDLDIEQYIYKDRFVSILKVK